MPTALTCPWCGAPLPPPAAGQTMLRCAYCAASSSLGGERAQPSAGAPPVDPTLRVRVMETFGGAMTGGASPYDALIAAARERLGPMGQTDAFARVVLALAADFDAQNGTKVSEEAVAMGRLIETYLKAIDGLRSAPSYEVNIPYFTATGSGPVHFQRTLTPAQIAELAAREPKKKKKGWFS